MNICHITVSGRLTGDAKLGKSESGSDFARFTIARNRKNRDGEEVAEFYSCVWFGKYATKAAEGLKKGAKVVVDGDFTVGTYDRDDSEMPGISLDVRVNSCDVLGMLRQAE
jgi:single-strand DNA-binding protein